FGLLRIHRAIVQLIAFEENLDERRARGDRALDQGLRKRIFNVFLERPAQRARAVAAVGERLVEYPLLSFVGYGHGNRLLRQIRVQLRDHKLQYLDQVDLAERAEDDDFVQPVQELRIKRSLYFVLHQILDLFGDHFFFSWFEAEQSLLGAEHELRERARYFGFADAGRTEKQEGTDGPVRAFQAGTAAADGAGKRGDGFILRNDPLV